MHIKIHIGQHKTGTTALQHGFKACRELLMQQGVYYPLPLAGFTNPSHFVLNLCALDEQRSSPMKDHLLKQGTFNLSELTTKLQEDLYQHYESAKALKCHTMLVSNEGLYLLNSEAEYQRLKQFFPFANSMSCYCTFRNLTEYRTSYIKQLQKQHIAFSQDITSYAYVEDDAWLFDYAAKKQLLERCFSHTHYIDYHKETAVPDVCAAMGIYIDPTVVKRLNVTP